MNLRESKGNMYDWTDYTWNPIKGICPHQCSYCYMREFWPKMKEPRLVEGALNGSDLSPVKEGSTVFVGSSIDVFASQIPDEWIRKVLVHCNEFPDIKFVFQTKNPSRFYQFEKKIPAGSLLGITLETNRAFRGIWTDVCPWPGQRVQDFLLVEGFKKFITIEPIIDFLFPVFITWILKVKPQFVNIGADSKGHGLPEPTKEDVQQLIDAMRNQGIYVREKDNLKRIMK